MRRIGLLPACQRIIFITLVAMVTGGCSQIDWARVSKAAERAATDPLTLGGAGAAALFTLDGNNFDTRLSEWATSNTPVFGSQQEALDASDRLRSATDYGAKLTALLVPTPKKGNEWLWDKTKTLLLESVSASLTLNMTGVLKRTTNREPPGDSISRDSFPSAHASTAFNDASFGNLHVQQFNLPSSARHLLSAGFFTLAGGTAWARVEGGVHYPSDVLFGAAVGNFFTIFIYDAFICNKTETMSGLPLLTVTAGTDGVLLFYHAQF